MREYVQTQQRAPQDVIRLSESILRDRPSRQALPAVTVQLTCEQPTISDLQVAAQDRRLQLSMRSMTGMQRATSQFIAPSSDCPRARQQMDASAKSIRMAERSIRAETRDGLKRFHSTSIWRAQYAPAATFSS